MPRSMFATLVAMFIHFGGEDPYFYSHKGS
ncbi:hypothetical protein EMIT07CA2_90034 [Brevibacillus sp. IT-7CA2]